MTSNRLLGLDFFKERVDGWLSLSGGRIGPAERSPTPGAQGGAAAVRRGRRRTATGPVYHARPTSPSSSRSESTKSLRSRRPPVGREVRRRTARAAARRRVDESRGSYMTGSARVSRRPRGALYPRPGTAQVYVYPNARDGRLIADVVRLDKATPKASSRRSPRSSSNDCRCARRKGGSRSLPSRQRPAAPVTEDRGCC
jgi:hypothetical protein